MEKRYTMKEFEEMYLKAQQEAIEELDNSMKETIEEKGKDKDPMFMFGFTMQNVMATAKVYSKLFKVEE